MKRIGFFFLVSLILVFSCVTGPEPVSQPPAPAQDTTPAKVEPVVSPEPISQPAPPPQTAPPPIEEKHFDPSSITEERLATTKADVQALIADLNRIIRARNFNAWRSYLADSYFQEISSQDFLAAMTEELYKRDQIVATNTGKDPRRIPKKILKTPRDYFDSVVVPSRSNDRMDDLDYVSETQVKAYTVDNRGNWLVLYDLELIDGKWKIIN